MRLNIRDKDGEEGEIDIKGGAPRQHEQHHRVELVPARLLLGQ